MSLLFCPRCLRAQPAEANFCHFDGVEIRPGSVVARPASVDSPKPRLEASLRRLLLGSLFVGDVRRETLTVSNRGAGILRGTITVSDGGDWLRLAPAQSGEKESLDSFSSDERAEIGVSAAIETASAQAFALYVDTRALAAPCECLGRLTLITNGGAVEVPVQLTLAVRPFPEAPLRGAIHARALAARMQAHPREAAQLLESGVVARWFASNGWLDPVPGPSAPGMAAVQQFFESLGLTRPPRIQLSRNEIDMIVLWPEAATETIRLWTEERRWLYAWIESDVMWLRPAVAAVAGPAEAACAFEVDSSLLEPDSMHEGRMRLVANGGQDLSLLVRLDVRRPHEPFTRRLFRWT